MGYLGKSILGRGKSIAKTSRQKGAGCVEEQQGGWRGQGRKNKSHPGGRWAKGVCRAS